MSATPTDRKYAPEFQRMLEYAAYDCAVRGDSEIGADHLLLGLFREDYPLIDEVLASFQVDSMVVLGRLLRLHPDAAQPTRPEAVAMGEEGLQVIALAESEAERLESQVVAPAHTFLGLLAFHRDHLERYFIREAVYLQREERVISQVRDLVRWLRLSGSGAASSRDVERLDENTVVGLESIQLETPNPREMKAFAVRLRMLKRFRGK